MKEYLLPTRIVKSSGVVGENNLFKAKGFQTVHDMDPKNWKKLTKLEGLGSYIILDFGKEMHGGIRMLTGWIYEGNCKILVRFGESVGEVNAKIDERGACNAHTPREFEITACGSGDLRVGKTGFRFVRIELLEDKYINIRNVYCDNEILGKKPIYTYTGNDETIKNIFETAKRTVDLCASSGYIWDGVKRDRLVWVGDLAPEVMALTTLYGRVPEVERSLTFAKKHSPLPKFMNDIYTYSMWWLIILCDYYKDFKCADYVKKNLKYAVELIGVLDGLVCENGEFSSDARYLVDWPTRNTEDELAGVRAIFLMALNSAAYLFEEFDINCELVEKIRAKLNKKPIEVVRMKQVIALKYFATNQITDEEYGKLIEGGAKGLSTFMSYYILTAIASRDKALAIQIMKQYYGAMLDRGATTFWEDFNMEWLEGSGRIDELDESKKDIHGDYGAFCYVGYRHSLCHGWSAGVIRFIKENC